MPSPTPGDSSASHQQPGSVLPEPESNKAPKPPKEKKSKHKIPSVRSDLFAQILIGVVLGVACGLFFGELCKPLAVLGDMFVGLLRVTVLPYIGVALIASLARLQISSGLRLLRVGICILASLWGAALATASILPLTFPEWRSGTFFSTALIAPIPEFNLVEFFVPANIFSALADNQVPAIVLFCIACGLALAKVKGRKVLVKQLDIAAAMLIRVSLAIAHLAPFGVFAITANTVGTLSIAEIIRLQGYLSRTPVVRPSWRSSCSHCWYQPSRRWAIDRSSASPRNPC